MKRIFAISVALVFTSFLVGCGLDVSQVRNLRRVDSIITWTAPTNIPDEYQHFGFAFRFLDAEHNEIPISGADGILLVNVTPVVPLATFFVLPDLELTSFNLHNIVSNSARDRIHRISVATAFQMENQTVPHVNWNTARTLAIPQTIFN